MKIIKILILSFIMVGVNSSCEDFLTEIPQSQLDATTFYSTGQSAEIGITGCYNRFYDQDCYSMMVHLVQMSTDDIMQPSGANFLYKDRANLKAPNANGGIWSNFYQALVNVNFLLQEVEKMSPDLFPNASRKTEILGEGHLLRGMIYYYLYNTWGEVPLIDAFSDDPEELLIGQASLPEIRAFIVQEFEAAEENLPNIIESYPDDAVTNLRKGRASKWAAKAYLARMSLEEADWQGALDYSNEIINSGLYPFTNVWRTIFDHPMNASESILEQQNDFSPGFFGSGLYGWFMGFDYEWSPDARSIFEQPDTIGGLPQHHDVRYGWSATPHPFGGTFSPNKYLGPEGFADGGIESANFNLIRLTELLLNKAEALNEINFAANETEVINILNMIRARAEDANFTNEWYAGAPVGSTGIPPLDAADYDTQDELRQVIREERRRELMFEDIIRWVDLKRWDKDYLKTVTNSPTDNHLYWPIPPDQILRNPELTQNPAYNE